VSSEPPEPEHDDEIEIDVEPELLEERTGNIPVAIGAPVPVLVVAASAGTASRLRVALGMDRVAAVTHGDLEGVERALAGAPLVAIVDASDVPPLSAEDLALALAETRAVRAVLGVDLPYGRRFAEQCERAGHSYVGIRVADGLEPLLDLVASRRA